MRGRVILIPSLAWMLLGVVLGHEVFAAKDDEPSPIRFFRVLAPEDRMKDWPLGEAKYLPLDAAEFDRLVAAVQSHVAETSAAPAVSARYEAKLVGEQLVGKASVDVALAAAKGTVPFSPTTASPWYPRKSGQSPTPAMLPWEPCNLALGTATWTAMPEGPSKTAHRVSLGLSSNGKQELMVERPGQLSFDWSLNGRRDPGDIMSFSLELPNSPANQLVLELPPNVTPTLDRGMVVGSEPAGEQSRRWQIELGGNNRFRLRIVPIGTTGRRPQLALLRESRTYDVSPRGLEVSVHWKLQVHNEPLQQVSVLLDPGLQLVSARCGKAPIPWSSASSPDGRGTRVVLSLSEPIRDIERVIRLRAVGRVVFDRPWRLPRIRAEGLFWQEGNLTLLMSDPLVAEQILPVGCEQTDTGPLLAPRTGESAQFQSFDPDATVELLLSHCDAADRKIALLGALGMMVVMLPAAGRAGKVWRLMVLLIMFAGAFYVGAARGEEPSTESAKPLEKNTASSSPLYRVFVPIDTTQKPTSGKVYVPEPLYRELHRRAAALAEKPHGWQIVGATYRGTLLAEAAADRLAVETLHVQYDLRVFDRAVRVRIPLRSEGVNLLPNGARIDGHPIEPEWEPDGAALALDVATPGDYRLELALRPIRRDAEGRGGFDVAIPRIATSRLELALPETPPLVEVTSACGATRVENDPPRLSADLGPADRLTVRWHEGAALGSAGPAVDVEQFTWLKVQPGSVVVAVKFKLHVLEGQIQQVQLATDPRLRLLPLPGDNPPTVHAGPATGQTRYITLRWAGPLPDRMTLDATFLLSGALGVGNFRLPQIELLDARTTQRWMAVGVDPSLSREELPTQPLETVAVADFLKAWGASDHAQKPQVAYRLPDGEIDWTLSTRPREPHTTTSQTLTLQFDQDRVKSVFEAELTTTSGYLFQYRLTVPDDMKIESVSLLEEGVERVGRWSQNVHGAVTIFLSGPVSGRQKLALRGQMPIHAGEDWLAPRMRVERCELRQTMFRLFCRPDVRLAVYGGRQGAGNEPPGNAAAAEPYRFVEAFVWDGVQPLSVAVTVTPNL